MMRNILKVFILTILLFSCKTSYDKGYSLQCNKNQIQEETKEILREKQEYIDSCYQSVISLNTIDNYTLFLQVFPIDIYSEEIKNKRRKLFLQKEKVEESQFNIEEIIKENPCYIPIYKNIDYLRNKNIELENLYNSVLDSMNPYRNRFIVGDLNTLNKEGKSRGIKEKFFNINEGWEFKELFEFAITNNIPTDSISIIDTRKIKTIIPNLKEQKKIKKQLLLYNNYVSKVGRYLEDEIEKEYSSYGGYRYTGQKLCFCEISEDTILLIAEHITSARGKTRHKTSTDSITGISTYEYSEAFPIGKQRKYYAAHNRITIRNWETSRKYNKSDIYRDSLLGGGNARVTFFDEKSQLPNFMLIDPDPTYPGAMKMNGIHEGSLSNMSRCMLGTPQSLGCFRTTDYGSKFCRWWIPRFANLFIYFDEDRYTNGELPENEMNGIKLPFGNRKEGNLFRVWVNKNYPNYAKKTDLEENGSCSNCFIQAAWEEFYREYLKTKEGKKLDFTPPKTISENDEKEEMIEILEREIVTKHDKIDLTQFDIIEEYYIIIGCFNEVKNATSYGGKFRNKGHNISVFYNSSAQCHFVSIGPYQNKQKSLSDLPSIQKNIDKEAWIYTKIVK